MEYKKIDEGVYIEFGKYLIQEGKNKKISKDQIEFLQACRGGKNSFLSYLQTNLLNKENAIKEGKNISFSHKFTEAEFRFPPQDTQKIIWNTFNKVDKQNLGSCGFWANVVIEMIEHDFIRPEYLASNLNGVNETGAYMLDMALKSDDSEKIDTCVRRILRSMGNSQPRGKRAIFNDFYLGKSYWRWHWANHISKKINLSVEKILAVLDEKGYAVFSDKMHSHKSYISQTNTLGGLLLYLNENQDTLVKNIGKIIDTLSYLSAWKAIEAQSPELNKKEIELIANNN